MIFRDGATLLPRVGEGFEGWLERLERSTRFDILGRDRSRCRAVVTLAHGNESSGARAVHALLLAGLVPAVDLSIFVLSVEAALAEPRFSHRALPGRRDQNRCFHPPHGDDREGERAAALLAEVRVLAPEAVLDVHNTSSDGPPYGVTTRDDPERRALTSFFADHLVITDIRLGALMEALEDDAPVVTIECGGADDGASHAVGLEGLRAFAVADEVLARPPGSPAIHVLRHPVRVELARGARIAYGDPDASADLVLKTDIHRHNFDPVGPEDVLGWVPGGALDVLEARRADGRDIAADLFALDCGRLRPRRPMDLLMVTTDPVIARQDCLFYAVPPEE